MLTNFAVKLHMNFCQISFRGELDIDSGGLEREYCTLMGREILRIILNMRKEILL